MDLLITLMKKEHWYLHCRAEILRPYQHDPVPCNVSEKIEDIGGDMNHIHRVTIQLFCSENCVRGNDHGSITVIVKTAPDEVLVCICRVNP